MGRGRLSLRQSPEHPSHRERGREVQERFRAPRRSVRPAARVFSPVSTRHKHGITDNTDRSPRSHELVTFPRLLHDAGYETAFIGKWHMGLDDNARPGIDHWVSVKGQGNYLDPEFNVNGERKKIPRLLHRHPESVRRRFSETAAPKPFLLYVSHKAVHPDLIQYADGSVSDVGGGSSFPPSDTRRYTRMTPFPIAPTTANRRKANPPCSARSPICPRSARTPSPTTKPFAIACGCWRRRTKAWARCSRSSKRRSSWTTRSSLHE